MKILLITDYYYPYNPGGTEWSVYELAKSLKKNNVQTKVVTLNYGTKEKELYNGIEIIRLPFFKKLKNKRNVINPFWQNNPIFFIFSAIHMFKVQKREKAHVLHVHGKFLIPATFIAGLLTKTPTVVSLRDKQILCSIGKCFYDGKIQACSLSQYIKKDFPWFYKNYVSSKNFLVLLYVFFGAIWARLSYSIIKHLLNKFDKIIAISNSQKKYLEANGIKNVQVIYNTASFERLPPPILGKKRIIFAGKFSQGKGADLLLKSFSNISKNSEIRLEIAGSIDNRYASNINYEKINVLGELKHSIISSKYKNSTVTVMPSIYPEAFGRVALESISQGTPVVVVNTGALPEIVDDMETGRVVKPDPELLSNAIKEVIKNEKKYKETIRDRLNLLKVKFYKKPLKSHLQLYKHLSR